MEPHLHSSAQQSKHRPWRPVQLSAVVLAVLAAASSAMAGSARTPAEPVLLQAASTDRLIVKYRADTSPAGAAVRKALNPDRLKSLQSIAATAGVQLSHLRSAAQGAHVLQLKRKLAGSEIAALAQALAASDPTIDYVEPDLILHAQLTPNDSLFASQWSLTETTGGIRAPQAWDLSTGAGIVVAVIDTGYRPHADLAANIVGGHDFIGDTFVANDGDGRDADAQDPGDAMAANECGAGSPADTSSWHGTHVAGTIAAVANNGNGVAGVAYGAKIVPARVLGKCGGYTSDIADAITWSSGGSVAGVPANAYPARVLNLSLGGGGACGSLLQSAIDGARSRNSVVVVAAGNSNANASGFSPANCTGVVTVAATNRNGSRAFYSNYGNAVTLAAPGGDTSGSTSNGILSTLNSGTNAPADDNYAYYQGTSMATPHVAGVVALMLAKNPSLTPDQVAQALKSSARAFPGTCNGCGAGIVNAEAAVQAAAGGGGTGGPTTTAESEPNNTTSTANAVAAPGTVNGVIGTPADQDWYAIDLPAGSTLTATMKPSTTGDFELQVYNAAGGLEGKNPAGTGQTEIVQSSNMTGATSKRYVLVKFVRGGFGPTMGKYSLNLAW